jgi:hypothetical protein
MLKKILNSVSNSKNEIEKKSISPVATLENKNFSVCEICGSENFYLPIKSNRWECRECNPPKSERFIAQTKQGRRIDETTENDRYHPGWAEVDPAQSWGPYVLKSKKPVCKCGSEYFEETGTVCEVKKFCVCCREEIFCVDFA